MQPILQTLFTQRVVFPEPPPRHIRRALHAAGFRFNGAFWHHTTGTASPIGNAQLEDILALHNQENRITALAPTIKIC